jgi:hypothetical protein
MILVNSKFKDFCPLFFFIYPIHGQCENGNLDLELKGNMNWNFDLKLKRKIFLLGTISDKKRHKKMN